MLYNCEGFLDEGLSLQVGCFSAAAGTFLPQGCLSAGHGVIGNWCERERKIT